MIARAALLALLLAIPAALHAQTPAEAAAAASEALLSATRDLDAARSAKDRVAALTRTIRAYETGQAALREAARQVELREATLALQFEAKREEVARLLAVLSGIEAEPAPLLLLHPDGPLGTIRSGMLLADVTPALQQEADRLKAELAELATLRGLQAGMARTLVEGLQAAQAARAALGQAISERTSLPRRYTEDPQALADLLASAKSLQSFAAGLALDPDLGASFAGAKGTLDLPVLGSVLLKPGETDAAGVTRPGLTLATAPGALVRTPWPATIRYRGPLLDYGNVMILEPGAGYLLILAGLEQAYGAVGEVLPQGAPLGLMAGGVASGGAGTDEFAAPQNEGGARETETLYLELRQGAEPVDPMAWFEVTAGAKD